MELRQYIKHLQDIESKHGNLQVKKWYRGGTVDAHIPFVDFMLSLSKWQTRERLWMPSDHESRKGKKIVQV